MPTITGTSQNDSITTAAASSGVTGGPATAGADYVDAQDGSDTVLAGGGNDTVLGGTGNDLLFGGDGDDSILAGSGNDTVRGSGGNDSIDGGESSTRNTADYRTIFGADGYSGGAISALWLSDTSITVTKTNGTDSLLNINAVFGTAGADSFDLSAVSTTVFFTQQARGGAGNDTIKGNGTSRTVADYADAPKAITVDLGAGTATQDGYDGTDTLINVRRITASNGYDDTLTGSGDNDTFFVPGAGNKVITGGLGSDTWRYGANTSVVVDLGVAPLAEGYQGTANKGATTDTLYSIENAYGGGADDSIYGSAGNNVLSGDTGADLLDGRDGFDRVDYTVFNAAAITAGVIVNLGTGPIIYGGVTVAAGTARDPWGFTDTLVSIEAITGTLLNDTVQGGTADNSLFGNDGDDSLLGGGGNDTLEGGTGRDRLYGGNGNDVIDVGPVSEHNDFAYGEAGNDDLRGRIIGSSFGYHVYLEGGIGNDTIRGYNVFDNIADYSNAASAVVATLGTTGAASLANGETDTLDRIIHIRGSIFADSITGTGASEYVMAGAGGADTLDGGAGTDRVEYADYFGPGGGALTGTGVTVDLSTGRATVGGAVQQLLSFENVVGSDFDDSLLGDALSNEFRPVAGDDSIDGGNGFDTVRYTYVANFIGFLGGNYTQATMTGIVGNLTTGLVTDPWGFTDHLSNIEALQGTALADDLTGKVILDTVAAAGSEALLRGLAGNDTLRAPADDTFVTADYREDPAAVRVNLSGTATVLGGISLAAYSARDGWGNTDTLDHIQRAIGSNYNDVLLGSDRADRLYGWIGDDTLSGGAGDDTLGGGEGVDLYAGGTGFDGIVFAPRSATEKQVTSGAVASLLTGLVANDGYGNAESMQGGAANDLEFLTGTILADDLTGRRILEPNGYGANQIAMLRGNQGDDTLRAAPGDGYWVATDHGGDPAGVTVNLADQATTDGWGNHDTLVNIGAARGSAYADTFVGDANDNWFRGEAGDDTIEGGGGLDTVSYTTATAGVLLDLVLGTAEDGLGGTDRLSAVENANGSNTTNDTLRGDGAANRFRGYGGDDLLEGRGGSDTLEGGAGQDSLDGGAGADSLAGGAGDDTYTVDNAGDGVAELAGEGYDRVFSAVSLVLPAHVEELRLIGAALSATGGDGNDRLFGNALGNLLSGQGGNDSLEGGGGADTLQGGQGDDHYYVDSALDTVTEAAGQGYDRIWATASATIAANVEELRLTGAANLNAYGDGADNRLFGNAGANRLEGAGGGDSLDGGAGADTLVGGTGDDNYYLNDTLDTVVEAAGEGFDRAWATVSATLALNVEELRLTGAANLSGTGNAQANRLWGNAGNNLLDGAGGDDLLVGMGGSDTLIGGLGADTLTGGAGADSFRWNSAAEGGDAITDYVGAEDSILVAASGFGLAGITDLVAAGRYVANAAGAATSDPGIGQFVYRTTTATLLWDADGLGGADAVVLVKLGAGATGWSGSEILVVA